MSIKEEILTKLAERDDNESYPFNILNEKKFYLKDSIEAYDDFMKYEVNKVELRDALINMPKNKNAGVEEVKKNYLVTIIHSIKTASSPIGLVRL